MRAIQIDRYGGPEVIIRRELPIPNPRPGELLIRLAYSGINFMDIHTRQGNYADSRTYPQTMPTSLGIEGAGRVERTGSGVNEFREGDRRSRKFEDPLFRVETLPGAPPELVGGGKTFIDGRINDTDCAVAISFAQAYSRSRGTPIQALTKAIAAATDSHAPGMARLSVS